MINEVERLQNLEKDVEETAYSKFTARQSIENFFKNDARRNKWGLYVAG